MKKYNLHYQIIVWYSQSFGSMDCNGEHQREMHGHLMTAAHGPTPASVQTHTDTVWTSAKDSPRFVTSGGNMRHDSHDSQLRAEESLSPRRPEVQQGLRSGVCVGSGVLRRTGAVRSRRVWRVSLKIQFLVQFHGGKTHTTLKTEINILDHDETQWR